MQDPALRRPGRFDREFYFPLPDASARAKILEIYTKEWSPPLSKKLIDRMANAWCNFSKVRSLPNLPDNPTIVPILEMLSFKEADLAHG